ncbi:unnamed protein product [Peniophora sp. CBMAI 1063]|nr:unnamed protein product [Peniophora sp. CBMAI 1063]
MSSTQYVKRVDGLSEEQKRLYEAKNMSIAQDAMTEGMLKVPVHKNLQHYADVRVYSSRKPDLSAHNIQRNFAQDHVYFVDDHAKKTSILCERGTLREASTCFTAMVWHLSVMPFLFQHDVNRNENWARSGAQHLILATLGLPETQRVKEGIQNIHTMASLRTRQNGLKAFRNYTVAGEDTICLSLPFSTHPEHVLPHEKIISIPPVLDPRGVASSYVERKGHVVTSRNLLDVWLADPTHEAGRYRCDPVLPEILRQGQIVRVEVVFRIVPAGNDVALRMDMKSVVIINTEVATNIAFAERALELQREQELTTYLLGGAGPSGTIIQPSSDFNRTFTPSQDVQNGGDASMVEEPTPVVFEEAERFVASGWEEFNGREKGKGKETETAKDGDVSLDGMLYLPGGPFVES